MTTAAASAGELPWTQADLVARKLFLSGHTTITLENGPTDATVSVAIDSRFVGRRTESRLVIDRTTGASVEREKIQHGSDPYRKVYSFHDGFVRELRASPANDAERNRGMAHWSKVRTTEHPWPDARCRDALHTEALFWLLATTALTPGDPPLERCAFTGDGYVMLEIEALEHARESRDFDIAGTTGRRSDSSSVETLHLRLDGRALDEDAAREIDFLGLEGTIGLVLDATTGAPIRVTGDIPPLGGITVRLDRLTP